MEQGKKNVPTCTKPPLSVGECHYLLKCNAEGRLVAIPELEWTKKECHGWPLDQVKDMLDVCEACFKEASAELNLRTIVLRKPRAVGMIQGAKLSALTAADSMRQANQLAGATASTAAVEPSVGKTIVM